jgi:membrane fusion protein (multidrug efflux system)
MKEPGKQGGFIMNKRMIIMLASIAVFFVAIGSFKFLQIKAAIAQGSSWQPPPEAVTTIVASQEKWPSTLSVIGTVAAVHGVTVSADLPGIVERISFESGQHVQPGEALVSLDTRQERAQLAAARSQLELSRLNFDRTKQLLARGVIAQAEYDRLDAETKQAEARVGEIQATIDRKQIRAPFAGTLGIRQVNLGQYLEAGSAVVPLQSMDPVYVNFDVPQDLAALKAGDEVRVTADSIASEGPVGRVTAINSVVDEATRTVQIQSEFRNPHERLRPGMFVEVEARLGTSAPIVALPATAVSYAPYGNSVYVVKDLKSKDGKSYRGVEQRFIKLGSGRGDQVAVVSGLKAGEEVVTSGVFKLRNGASVLVNNKIRPSNSSAPKPEDS